MLTDVRSDVATFQTVHVRIGPLVGTKVSSCPI